MNHRKFLLGLSLVIVGSTTFGAATAYLIKEIFESRKVKTSPSVSAAEMIAMLKASKLVMDKAQDGAYDHVIDKDAAIRSDFEFYKMTLLIES